MCGEVLWGKHHSGERFLTSEYDGAVATVYGASSFDLVDWIYIPAGLPVVGKHRVSRKFYGPEPSDGCGSVPHYWCESAGIGCAETLAGFKFYYIKDYPLDWPRNEEVVRKADGFVKVH